MSNSNQENIESRLATYVDGELEAKDRLEIEQHLQQNPQYRRVIDDLRRQRDWLRSLPREAAPMELSEAFNSQLERSVLLDTRVDADTPRMRIGPMPRIVAAAAILLLTAGLAIIVYFVLPDRNVRTVSIATPASRPTAPAPMPPAATPLARQAEGQNSTERETSRKEMQPVAKAPTHAPLPLAPETPSAAAPVKPDRAMADKSKDQFAKNLAKQGDATAASVQSQPRDAELDRLARNVSQDAQVNELLAGGNGANGAGSGASAPQKAVVLVVRTSDPQQVQRELAKLLNNDNIQWQSAPQPVAVALNTSLSHQGNEVWNDSRMPNRREIDSHAIEGNRDERVQDAVSAHPVVPSAGEVPVSAAVESNQAWESNATPISTLYVAHGLSREQAQELSAHLSQVDEPDQADAGRQLGEYVYFRGVPGEANGVASKRAVENAPPPVGNNSSFELRGPSETSGAPLAAAAARALPGQTNTPAEKREAVSGADNRMQVSGEALHRQSRPDGNGPSAEFGQARPGAAPQQQQALSSMVDQRGAQQSKIVGGATTQSVAVQENALPSAPGNADGSRDRISAKAGADSPQDRQLALDAPVGIAPAQSPSTQNLQQPAPEAGKVDVVIVVQMETRGVSVIAATQAASPLPQGALSPVPTPTTAPAASAKK